MDPEINNEFEDSTKRCCSDDNLGSSSDSIDSNDDSNTEANSLQDEREKQNEQYVKVKKTVVSMAIPIAKDAPSARFQSLVLDDDVPEVLSEEGEVSGDELLTKYFSNRKLSDYTGVVKEEPQEKQEFKTKEGFLYKIGGNSGVWQKRWFSLSKDLLAYYGNSNARRLLGQLVLEDILKVQLNPSAMVFAVVTPGRSYYLGKGLNKEELDSWLEAINYNWVQAKRRAVKRLADIDPLAPVSPEFLADRAYCLETVMNKRGGTNSKWQKRSFFLTSEFITYKNGTDVAGRIPLSAIINVQGMDVIKGKPNSFAIITPYRVYYLEAFTPEEKRKMDKGSLSKFESFSVEARVGSREFD